VKTVPSREQRALGQRDVRGYRHGSITGQGSHDSPSSPWPYPSNGGHPGSPGPLRNRVHATTALAFRASAAAVVPRTGLRARTAQRDAHVQRNTIHSVLRVSQGAQSSQPGHTDGGRAAASRPTATRAGSWDCCWAARPTRGPRSQRWTRRHTSKTRLTTKELPAARERQQPSRHAASAADPTEARRREIRHPMPSSLGARTASLRDGPTHRLARRITRWLKSPGLSSPGRGRAWVISAGTCRHGAEGRLPIPVMTSRLPSAIQIDHLALRCISSGVCTELAQRSTWDAPPLAAPPFAGLQIAGGSAMTPVCGFKFQRACAHAANRAHCR